MSKFQVLSFDPERGDRMIVQISNSYSQEEMDEIHSLVEKLILGGEWPLLSMPDDITFTIIRVNGTPLQNEDYLVTLHHEES